MSTNASANQPKNDDGEEPHVESINTTELPFLLTHWLYHFGQKHDIEDDDPASRNALKTIRRATSDLASAFSALGMYGKAVRPSIGTSVLPRYQSPQNATFSDRKRQWSGLPVEHLENLIGASVSSGQFADFLAFQRSSSNLVQAADEALQQQRQKPKTGRTVEDAVIVEEEMKRFSSVPIAPSILQHPAVLGLRRSNKDNEASFTGNDVNTEPLIESRYLKLCTEAARSLRKRLDLREACYEQEAEIRRIRSSLARQQRTLQDANAQKEAFNQRSITDSVSHAAVWDQIDDTESNCTRVMAQLNRKLNELTTSHTSALHELRSVEENSISLFQKVKGHIQGCRDPLYAVSKGTAGKRNRQGVLSMVVARQHGGTRYPGRTQLPRAPATVLVSQTQKEIFCSRLSHAATINIHLSYPVYCLRFDRSGRYFITGADDYLVKVFCMGEALPPRQGGRYLKRNCRGISRGAVLVCTLRGHAGVINDIDVSSDNCFLATASEDGDCRVWGLKNGCPVAILRGHVGGCNMVSWSTLTPYRLVTTGHDGLARTWDIREAALKRYACTVGERPEYCLKLTEEEKQSNEKENRDSTEQPPSNEIALPPLPAAGAGGNNQIPPPPLPAGNGMVPADGSLDNIAAPPAPPQGQARETATAPGRFIANSSIDEGVKLLAKLQHGALSDGGPGPGTRSRAPVKVICATRCPFGGHFATGADDGICRVWSDEDDLDVQTVDQRSSGSSFQWMGLSQTKRVKTASARSASSRLLLTLTGHLSAITDLQYSHAGDRILTASQKDGVVRIWSWGKDPVFATSQDIKKIVICLTNPCKEKVASTRSRRRDARNSAGSSKDAKVSCDVAVWTHDDSKIVTSQSQLVKQNSSEIHPGSQFLFLWDSRTGHCLLGISDAHTMPCPVIIPHPKDASLTCSAGADGLLQVWDWDTGKCIFRHSNIVEHGPANDNERGKPSGFLDGSFSPDGSGIVLTDDCGRVSMFDSMTFNKYEANESLSEVIARQNFACPHWMKEQYFSNDYYDLVYDTHGYCIERGSGQPPHLAPRGVRCNHSGAPRSDEVVNAFCSLRGPSPLPEHEVVWNRGYVRRQAQCVRDSNSGFHSYTSQRKTTQGEFNPETTILLAGTGRILSVEAKDQAQSGLQLRSPISSNEPSIPIERPRSTSSGRQLSSNYRWRDYNDLLQEAGEDDGADSDDEDFQLPTQASRTSRAPRSARASAQLSDEDEVLVVDDDEDLDGSVELGGETETENSPLRPSTQASSSRAPSRSSSRLNERERNVYVDEDSDEDVEIVSTNNTPSGPYVMDYAIHYFRLPKSGWIARKWLRRFESNTSYEGHKIYTPQVGDSVVYIPRAHIETIHQFPSLTPPWQSWPEEAVWPVVRCCIRNIRYRFPYIDYYGSQSNRGDQCKSVVAILTLEITGIPELSTDREFCWPKPSFINSHGSHVFELGMFENNTRPEFIFPCCLYVWRLKCLEDAIRDRKGSLDSLQVSSFYTTENEEVEDEQMIPYRGNLVDYSQIDAEHTSSHLCNSGYGALAVVWPGTNDEPGIFSPWEITVHRPKKHSAVEIPGLTDDEKVRVRKALRELKRNSVIKEWFSLPVDERRYSDYSHRVEVSMDLAFVEKRLQADYYSTLQSVVADIRLIRDNCMKYNGSATDLSKAIQTGYKEFECELLTEKERRFYEDCETIAADSSSAPVTVQLQRSAIAGGQANRHRSAGSTSDDQRSSLGNLPRPVGPRPVRRAQARNRSNASQLEANQRRSTRNTGEDTGRMSMAHSPSTVERQNDRFLGNVDGQYITYFGTVQRSYSRFSTSNQSDELEETNDDGEVTDSASRHVAFQMQGSDGIQQDSAEPRIVRSNASRETRNRGENNLDAFSGTSPQSSRRSARIRSRFDPNDSSKEEKKADNNEIISGQLTGIRFDLEQENKISPERPSNNEREVTNIAALSEQESSANMSGADNEADEASLESEVECGDELSTNSSHSRSQSVESEDGSKDEPNTNGSKPEPKTGSARSSRRRNVKSGPIYKDLTSSEIEDEGYSDEASPDRRSPRKRRIKISARNTSKNASHPAAEAPARRSSRQVAKRNKVDDNGSNLLEQQPLNSRRSARQSSKHNVSYDGGSDGGEKKLPARKSARQSSARKLSYDEGSDDYESPEPDDYESPAPSRRSARKRPHPSTNDKPDSNLASKEPSSPTRRSARITSKLHTPVFEHVDYPSPAEEEMYLTKKSRASALHNNDESDYEEETPTPTRKVSTRKNIDDRSGLLEESPSRRSARKVAKRYDLNDDDDNDDSSSLEEPPSSTIRRSTRKVTQRYDLNDDDDESNSLEESPVPTSRRSTRKAAKRYDLNDDDDESNFLEETHSPSGGLHKGHELNDDEYDSAEEESAMVTRRTRKATQRHASNDDVSAGDQPQTPVRRSGRKTSSRKVSNEDTVCDQIEEPSHSARRSTRNMAKKSESHDDMESSADDFVPSRTRRPKRETEAQQDDDLFLQQQERNVTRKRQQQELETTTSQPKRQKLVAKKQNLSSNARERHTRRRANWPEIPLKDITDVTNQVLESLRVYDQDDLFGIPVVEAHPNLAEAYLRKIDEPMDFRTIEEDRIHMYTSINDLREDLERTFKNCIKFNGPDTPFGQLASTMLEVMNESFHDACDMCGVEIG